MLSLLSGSFVVRATQNKGAEMHISEPKNGVTVRVKNLFASYAELASSVPVSRSAYTFTYARHG